MNVIVWKSVRERQRVQVLKSRLLAVYGYGSAMKSRAMQQVKTV